MEGDTFRRRKLPHWRVAGHSYFVTIRLHGTIPRKVLCELRNKLDKMKTESDCDELQMQRWQFKKIENILDNVSDEKKFLTEANVADMFLDELSKLEKEFQWMIPAVVLMPNHVHMLCVGECATIDINGFLKRLKGRTAVKANRLLDRTGNPFWAEESFDHWCRNAQKEESVIRYIINNPVKAGLVANAENWPWLKVNRRSEASE